MNDRELKVLLQRELDYPQLTLRAEQAIGDACGRLEPRGEREAGKRPWYAARPWRVVRISLTAVFAAFVCLILLNLSFPAVAENIPGVGKIFQTLNYKFGMGANLDTYEGIIQPVGVTGGEEDCRVTVREAYSEGKNLFLSLSLESGLEEIRSAQFLSARFIYDETKWGYREEASATVNGQTAEFHPGKEIVFSKKGNGFECAAVLKLPAEVKNGEKLHVVLNIDALRGLKEGTVYQSDTAPEVEYEKPITVEFEVTADTSRNVTVETAAASDGVTLTGYESTPSYFSVGFRYPAIKSALQQEPGIGWAEARTIDGKELDRNTERIDGYPELIEGAAPKVGDLVNQTTVFAGVPAGTKQVIVTLYNQCTDSYSAFVNGGWVGACVFAEFTVDLETGQAAPSETYRDAGYEKCPVEDYVKSLNGGLQFKEHLFMPGSSLGWGRLYAPEEWEAHSEEVGPACWTISFYADTTEELPLEVRFYLDGGLYKTVDIDQQEGRVPTEDGFVLPEEEYGIDVYEPFGTRDNPYDESIKRLYSVNVYVDESYMMLDAGEFSGTYQIVNWETGAVLFDSEKDIPEALYGLPEDR